MPPSIQIREASTDMRRILRTAIVLVVSACLLGCGTFHTTEIMRPMVIDSELEDEAELQAIEQLIASGKGERSIWLKATKWAIQSVGIYKYDGHRYQLVDLADVLDRKPENPHGWIYLGMHLMLQRQAEAAIEATEQGIRALQETRPAAVPDQAFIRQLHSVGVLNVALCNLVLERFDLAYATLSRLQNPESLDPFRKVAYHWIAVQALSALKKTTDARKELQSAKAIKLDPESKEAKRHTFDYPQYFEDQATGPSRRTSELYLEGMIALDESKPDDARERFEAAIAANPDMWEAHFGLVRALLAAREIDAARKELQLLAAKLPPTGFLRREIVYFALGNLERDENNLEAASAAYENAIAEAIQRADGYFNYFPFADLKPEAPASSIIARTLDPRRKGYPEAENNLGNTILALVERQELRGKIDRVAALEKAEGLLRRAAGNPTYRTPHIARTNLARAYHLQGDSAKSIEQAALALQCAPQYLPAVRFLLDAAAEIPNLEEAAPAYAIAFDALSLSRYAIGRDPSLMLVVKSARERLEKGPLQRERSRALSRLYILTQEWSIGLDLLTASQNQVPMSISTALGMARLEFSKGNITAADTWLDIALAEPSHESGPAAEIDRRDAHYVRSLVRLKQGNQVAARSEIDLARARWPGWTPGPIWSKETDATRHHVF